MSGKWWAFLVRGILAILFGVLALAIPGIALMTLVLLFGAYALIEGVLNTITALARPSRVTGGGIASVETGQPFPRRVEEHRPSWNLLLQGLVSIVAGLIALFRPGLTALAVLYLIAFWAVIHGVLALFALARMPRRDNRAWLFGLSGLVAFILGVLLFAHPAAGALAMIMWIGVCATLLGLALVALSIAAHRLLRGTRGEVLTAHGH